MSDDQPLQPRAPWPFPASSPPTPAPAPAPAPVGPGMNLEDDTPLTGGACNLDGTCESCQ